MTDGTTVHTVQEEDMAKVREVFQKALDAIIAATELSKQVQAMRGDVDKLRKDIEDTQARNIELDRMLSDTRRQRDEAEQALSQARKERDEATAKANNLQALQANTQDLLDRARTERDRFHMDYVDEEFTGLAIQEALDKANAKLEALHKAMGMEFKPFSPNLPEPAVPEVAQAIPTAPSGGPTGPALNEASPPTHRVYSNDPSFDWNRSREWDSERGQYYYEVSIVS